MEAPVSRVGRRRREVVLGDVWGRDPRVKAFATALGQDYAVALGQLTMLLLWAIANGCRDGHLCASADHIEDEVGGAVREEPTGQPLVEALLASGLLSYHEDVLAGDGEDIAVACHYRVDVWWEITRAPVEGEGCPA